MNISNIEKIVVAVLSNPNFFSPSATPDNKIKQVADLMHEVDKTANSK